MCLLCVWQHEIKSDGTSLIKEENHGMSSVTFD